MSLKLVPFESLGAVFYSPSIVTVAVSVAVYEIFSVKEWRDLENQVRGRLMSHFCRQWRHKPSASKTISSVFHLHNTSATRELSVYLHGWPAPSA